MNEQAKPHVDEQVTDVKQQTATEAPKQEERELTREEKTEISIHGLYHAAAGYLVAKLDSIEPGKREEHIKWVDNYLMNIKPYHLVSVSAAQQFFEMWSQHVVQSKDPIPRPVFFQMNNLEVLFQRYASGLNQSVLNIESEHGSDPTLKFEPLPVILLKENGGLDKDGKRLSFPIKFETFDKIGYGFLELFETEEVNPLDKTKKVKMLTEYPAIRVNGNYIAPNTIYRWKPVDKKTVMNAWHTKKSLITKKRAK